MIIKKNTKYLNHCLGDGSKKNIYITRYPGCSSLYEPNESVINLFTGISASEKGNFNVLNPWMGTADVLFALKFLQNHPKVDPDKIGIMGFSWGGQVTMWSGLDLIR